jgi:hypothetical protein
MMLQVQPTLCCVGPARIDLPHVTPEHVGELERLSGVADPRHLRASASAPVSAREVPHLLGGGFHHPIVAADYGRTDLRVRIASVTSRASSCRDFSAAPASGD